MHIISTDDLAKPLVMRIRLPQPPRGPLRCVQMRYQVLNKFFELEDVDHWGQLVFQCRVRPGGFAQKPGSLGNKYWPRHVRFDPNFETMEDLEWLVENPDDIVISGLMVREFGPKADANIHGLPCAYSVKLRAAKSHELLPSFCGFFIDQ